MTCRPMKRAARSGCDRFSVLRYSTKLFWAFLRATLSSPERAGPNSGGRGGSSVNKRDVDWVLSSLRHCSEQNILPRGFWGSLWVGVEGPKERKQ